MNYTNYTLTPFAQTAKMMRAVYGKMRLQTSVVPTNRPNPKDIQFVMIQKKNRKAVNPHIVEDTIIIRIVANSFYFNWITFRGVCYCVQHLDEHVVSFYFY